jgi:ATP-dependent Clp protease ATP-binding subunit ClpA
MHLDEMEDLLKKASGFAKEKGHRSITIKHFLLSALDHETICEKLKLHAINPITLKDELTRDLNAARRATIKNSNFSAPKPTKKMIKIIDTLKKNGGVIKDDDVVKLFIEERSVSKFLRLFRLDKIKKKIQSVDPQNKINKPEDIPFDLFLKDETNREKEKELESLLTNVNDRVLNNEIDPVIGRDKEITRAVQILCRRKKNNPLFIGDPGVGKTAIIEGIARKIEHGEVAERIKKLKIYSLDIGSLLAGTKFRGDMEKKLQNVLEFMKNDPNAVLFIDEIHTIVGCGVSSGSNVDIANLLKPVLTSGKIKCIGATTHQEFRELFEKDKALSRRFQRIAVKEPSVRATCKILKGIQGKLEEHHKVKYSNTAIKAAAVLSDKLIIDRRLPDKAIDLLDELGAKYSSVQAMDNVHSKVIRKLDVERLISEIAQVPYGVATKSERSLIRSLEDNLKSTIYGQDYAIETLVSAIKLAKAGLKNPDKPIGSFLFAGPTGVGKTELTRQLAKVMHMNLIRFDMSEFMESHSVSKLIGSPPGYTGYGSSGLLIQQMVTNPYSVILLDEIEKAHPDIVNILLQIMDYGKLTGSDGVEADFRHAIVIMTSNAGLKDDARSPIGFVADNQLLDKETFVSKCFPEEFCNRLTNIICFKKISGSILNLIVDKYIREMDVLLKEKKVKIKIDKAAKKWLVEKGYDERLGARPLERIIHQEIKKPLADHILFGELEKGGTAKVKLLNDQLHIVIG